MIHVRPSRAISSALWLVFMLLFVASFGALVSVRPQGVPTGRFIAVRDGPGPWYTSVQAAINAASDDPASPDTIFVYSGTYNEQIVLVKPVNLVGIRDNGDVRISGDALGRPLTVRGPAINSSITISGLTIDRGDATSAGSVPELRGCGGAVLITGASPTFTGNTVERSSASTSPSLVGRGGGICLVNSNAVLTSNVIDGNNAATAGPGRGGGVYISGGAPLLRFNSIVNNQASQASAEGNGGGVYLDATAASLIGNAVSDNHASFQPNNLSGASGNGGGVYVTNAPAGGPTLTLSGNFIGRNVATETGPGRGGGVFLAGFNGSLTNNIIIDNHGSNHSTGQGGGVFIDGGNPSLNFNEVISNNATNGTDGGGGGVYLLGSAAQLLGNTIVDNYECGADVVRSGGVRIENSTGWTLISNVVARNRPPPFPAGQFLGSSNCSTRLAAAGQSYEGYGITVDDSNGTMLHTTIADHNGFYPATQDHPFALTITQTGLDVEGSSNVTLVNTIISGQQIGARTRSNQSTVSLSHTLFFNNAGGNTSTSAGGSITNNDWQAGNPLFVDNTVYPKPDYHIRSASAARDAGRSTNATLDFDGEPRVFGTAPDLGADEFTQGFLLSKTPSANPATAGQPLTYVLTYKLKNDNPVSNVTLTDSLPPGVTDVVASDGGVVSGGAVTWPLGTLAPNAAGSVTVQVTPTTPGAALLNTARISGGDFASEATTNVAVRAADADGLQLTKTPSLNPAAAGQPLLYTLRYRLVGATAATNVVLVDALPPDVSAVAASDGGVVSGGVVRWELGTLQPGAAGSVTVRMTMPDTPGVTVLNTAIISGGPFAAEASASVTLRARGNFGGGAMFFPLVSR